MLPTILFKCVMKFCTEKRLFFYEGADPDEELTLEEALLSLLYVTYTSGNPSW